jgi:2,5-diketo-D-gluconate reductase A
MVAPVFTLNDGTGLPIVGFGTYPLRGNDGYVAMLSALQNGYRLIDTAVNYRNEVEAGRAVRDFIEQSGTPRPEQDPRPLARIRQCAPGVLGLTRTARPRPH